MTCDLCGKQEATVHLTEMVNEETRDLHLCQPCAKEKGVKLDTAFGLGELLAGLTDLDSQLEATGTKLAPCPQCGMRFEDFKKSGRLGCGACYEAFRQPLALLLKQIHGAAQHVGRVPAGTSPVAKLQAELDGLKARLKVAVKQEAFEDAAQVRDQIRVVEQQLKRAGGGRAQRHRSTQ